MSKKHLKRNIALSTIAILLGGIIMFTSFTGKPVDIKKNTDLSFEMDDSLKEILYYASLAPNSHNTQMWSVVYSQKNQFLIKLDDTRLLNQVDPSSREAYISIGSFLKNMEVASKAYGYSVDIQILQNIDRKNIDNKGIQNDTVDNYTNNNIIAKVSFSEASDTIVKTQSLSTLEKRHTDKRNFKDENLADKDVSKLLKKYSSHLNYYSKDSDKFKYIQNGTIKAMETQSNNQEKRDELAKWLRFSDAETLLNKDGLPAEQLGITGIKKSFYYLFTNRSTAKSDKYAKQGINMTKNQVNNCSGFFVITGDNSPTDWINTGMLLEEFWLDAVRKDISIHPMSQMLEEEKYKSEIQKELNLNKPVQMILRAGINDSYGENTKIRRNLSEFVTQDTVNSYSH